MSIDANIRNKISACGYITLADMIDMAMNEFTFSYYKNEEAIGVHSDFITAPEISQLFGEIVSLWCIDFWERFGKPKKCNLIELGPGSGTLMYDILRTLKKIAPDFYNSIKLHLVDINPILIEKQRSILSNFDIEKSWTSSISNINTHNNIIIANEFFDALSIDQYFKKKNFWHQVIIKTDSNSANLVFDHKPVTSKFSSQLDSEHPNAQDGAIIEESLNRLRVMQDISELILQNTGAALIVDYGYYIDPFKRTSAQYNSTLQSIKNHKYNPVLSNLGRSDLTSHVDFWELSRVAMNRGLNVLKVVSQKEFLLNYGIKKRLEFLVAKNPDRAKLLMAQYERLVGATQMGELFKVLCISNIK